MALRVLRSSLSSSSMEPSVPPLSSELRMVMYLLVARWLEGKKKEGKVETKLSVLSTSKK
jgi:hypothetical protein